MGNYNIGKWGVLFRNVIKGIRLLIKLLKIIYF